MSEIKVNSVVDASGGSTATINGYTPTASNMAGKNRIINGAMMIDQRNAGASITPTSGVYTVDRWGTALAQASKLTFQQVTDAPTGYKNSLKVTVASQYSPLSGDYFCVYQGIEGFNVVDLSFGSAGAVTVTLSAQVKSSVAGTYTVRLCNNVNNRSYVGTYSIASTGVWTPLIITIAGDQSGTWTTDNTMGIQVLFDLGSGSTFQTTAGSWQAGNYTRTSGSVTFVNQAAGATWQIAAVQLEKGSVATPFEHRLYGTELALCQRYYYRLKAGTSYANAGSGRAYSTTNGQAFVAMPVSMRSAPSSTGYSSLSDWNGAQASGSITALSPASQYSLDYRQMTIDITTTYTSGQAVALNANNTTNAWIEWSAEL